MRFNAALARRVALILGLSFPAFNAALADGRAVLPPRWMVEAYLSDAVVKPSRDDIARAIIPGLGMVPAFMGGGFSPLAGATAWNPSDKTAAQLVLSNSNLTVTNTSSAVARGVRALVGRSTGKHYWEVTADVVNIVSTSVDIGARGAAVSLTGSFPSLGFNVRAGGTISNSDDVYTSPIGSYASGDVIGIALDPANGFVYLSKNGVWGAGHDPVAGTGGFDCNVGTLYPHVVMTAISEQVTANFGATPFVYPVPAGFTEGFA